MYTILTILVSLIVEAFCFLITAGMLKVICWAFGFIFSWKLAIGIWFIMSLIRGCVRSSK